MRRSGRFFSRSVLAVLLTVSFLGQSVWAADIPGQGELPAMDADRKEMEGSVSVQAGYTYEIVPLLPPFNEYFYVKTEDPDPSDIRFVDKSSVYYEEGEEPSYLELEDVRFLDVVYEDKASGRVKGGYIFGADDLSLDGGELAIQKRSEDGRKYEDTGAVVQCPVVIDNIQYLIDTYTSESDGFFEKLDAVQNALDEIALYPIGLKDVNKKNKNLPYPLLTVSPYPELSLNEWYLMFEDSEERLFTRYLYPYILDSLGFPSVMAETAQRIDPSSSYKWGDAHYLVEVIKDGESRVYGGAGKGDIDPLYSDRVEKLFLFDGTQEDHAMNASLSQLKEKYQEYQAYTRQDLEAYRELIIGDTFSRTVGMSSWIRVGTEGWDLSYRSYAFVTHGSVYDPEDPGYAYSVEDVWVDGRYVNENNQFMKGEKFADHPNASIMMRAVEYTDRRGDLQCGDIRYDYDEEKDCWIYSDYRLEEEMVLTREEVEAMGVDKNTNIVPSGLIYDGSAYPGTPYEASQFEDVPEDEWYLHAVNYVFEKGLMVGVDETAFAPGQYIPRAQFAVILHRMSGEMKVDYSAKFPDVEPGLWYTDAVLWANSIDVVRGYSDTGLFGTGDKITREQMATMMYRYAEYEGDDTTKTTDLDRYTDASRVSGFAQDAMRWAVGSGIITGKDNETRLDPQGYATRAECAAIIMRFYQNYKERSETVS